VLLISDIDHFPAEHLNEALRRADQAWQEAQRHGRARAVAATGDEFEPVFSASRRLGLLPRLPQPPQRSTPQPPAELSL